MNDLSFSLPDYVCRPIAPGLTQVITPFSMGRDTNAVTFFVEKHDGGFLLRDHGNAAFHAANHGCVLTSTRWKSLNEIMTGAAMLAPDWELRASVADPESLSFAAADLVSAAIRLTTDELNQKPKSKRSFSDLVGDILTDVAGPRLRRGEKIIGSSGHEFEIPFVIDAPVMRLVQPLSSHDHGANWGGVSSAYFKFDDIKQAGPADTDRYIILEDIASAPDQGSVITSLSRVAIVLPFSSRSDWVPQLAAA